MGHILARILEIRLKTIRRWVEITNPEFPSGKAIFFQGIKTHSFAPSAFYFVLIFSIWQSKTSAEARRAPSVTETATSLRTWPCKQLTFQSRPPTDLHLKISRTRDCAGSHRPADFILICANRAKTCVSYDVCERCGVCAEDWQPLRCRHHPKVLAIMGLGKSIDIAKIGIDRASALRVISIGLAHTLPSFCFDGDMCKLEKENVE